MKTIQILAAAALAASLGIPALAQDADAVKSALRKKFPEAPIDTVRKIPYGSLYEVVGNGEVFYTDDKTTFLLIGTLVDVKTKENITEVRQRQVNAVKFENLPLESARPSANTPGALCVIAASIASNVSR